MYTNGGFIFCRLVGGLEIKKKKKKRAMFLFGVGAFDDRKKPMSHFEGSQAGEILPFGGRASFFVLFRPSTD